MQYDRDDIGWTSTRLSGEWSAPQFAVHLKPKLITLLIQNFEKLEPAVRVRVLLACLFLTREELEDHQALLETLAEIAREDEDEWVRVIALAVGDYSGQVDLRKVMEQFPVVDITVSELISQMKHTQSPTSCPPLENQYLSRRLRSSAPAAPGQNVHFTPRPQTLPIDEMVRTDNAQRPPAAGASRPPAAGLLSVHARRGMGTSGESDLFLPRQEIPRQGSLPARTKPGAAREPGAPGAKSSKVQSLLSGHQHPHGSPRHPGHGSPHASLDSPTGSPQKFPPSDTTGSHQRSPLGRMRSGSSQLQGDTAATGDSADDSGAAAAAVPRQSADGTQDAGPGLRHSSDAGHSSGPAEHGMGQELGRPAEMHVGATRQDERSGGGGGDDSTAQRAGGGGSDAAGDSNEDDEMEDVDIGRWGGAARSPDDSPPRLGIVDAQSGNLPAAIAMQAAEQGAGQAAQHAQHAGADNGPLPDTAARHDAAIEPSPATAISLAVELVKLSQSSLPAQVAAQHSPQQSPARAVALAAELVSSLAGLASGDADSANPAFVPPVAPNVSLTPIASSTLDRQVDERGDGLRVDEHGDGQEDRPPPRKRIRLKQPA